MADINQGDSVLVPGGYFPDDLDTTALALIVLRPPPDIVSSVLNEMLEYVNSDGTILVSHANASKTFSLCKPAIFREMVIFSRT